MGAAITVSFTRTVKPALLLLRGFRSTVVGKGHARPGMIAPERVGLAVESEWAGKRQAKPLL
jgi:hypothetical protein